MEKLQYNQSTAVRYNEKSLTQQHFEPDQNIRNIMRKYHESGNAVPLQQRSGAFYGDFTKIKDYRSALAAVDASKSAFLSLPSDIRIKFKNDPHALLAWLQNKNNYDEAVSLGIIPEKPQNQQKTAKAEKTTEKEVKA